MRLLSSLGVYSSPIAAIPAVGYWGSTGLLGGRPTATLQKPLTWLIGDEVPIIFGVKGVRPLCESHSVITE